MDLHFAFRPMIHFELIFFCVVQVRGEVHFCPVWMSSCSSHFLKNFPFLIALPLHKLFDHACVDLFLACLSYSIDLYTYSFVNVALP